MTPDSSPSAPEGTRERAGRAAPTVVITGATTGLGRALAQDLARLGANVVVTGRNAVQAAVIAGEIGEQHALGVACDVREVGDIAALWNAAVARFGRVDHWINNAGVGHRSARLDQLSVEEMAAVLDTNLTGSLLGARRAVEGMLAQGGGWVWLTEGLGSNGPVLAGRGPYSASKAGATRAFQVLVKECRGTPVAVGFLRPGIMPTRVTLGTPDPHRAAAPDRLLALLGDSPEDVARSFAPRILSARTNGQRLTWLTPGRIARRVLGAPLQRRHAVTGPAGCP